LLEVYNRGAASGNRAHAALQFGLNYGKTGAIFGIAAQYYSSRLSRRFLNSPPVRVRPPANAKM